MDPSVVAVSSAWDTLSTAGIFAMTPAWATLCATLTSVMTFAVTSAWATLTVVTFAWISAWADLGATGTTGVISSGTSDWATLTRLVAGSSARSAQSVVVKSAWAYPLLAATSAVGVNLGEPGTTAVKGQS